MEQIRIAFVAMPRMLREIIDQVVAPHPDLAVVGEFASPDGLRRVLDDLEPDLVIAAGDRIAFARLAGLLHARPEMKLLTVVRDGSQAFLYELRPHEVPLGELSATTLLDAIRAAHRTSTSAVGPTR